MRLRSAVMARPLIALSILLASVGVAFASVPAFKASEAPTFCSSCHEMQPFYDAWKSGAHKTTDCVDCHVDPGTWNHVTHKVIAAKELWVHVAGDPRFPTDDVSIPSARCLRCHTDIATKKTPSGFSHATHAAKAQCIECHRTTGHAVSTAALRQAGVLKAGVTAASEAASRAVQSTSGASASLAHVRISCTDCHSLEKWSCSKCHTPRHDARGTCTQCHVAGPAWTFVHPASADCGSCHTPPAKHFAGACSTCHSPAVAFAKTVYRHTSNDCETCHARPAKHRAGACATCHQRPGVSWAFSHPGAGACESCHARPSGHRGGACATCHQRPGVSWAFSHPSSSACGSCHKAPANHYGSSCASCHSRGVAFKNAKVRHTAGLNCARCHSAKHTSYPVSCGSCHRRPGASWAFSHPSSSSCASCHRSPASHYGTSCASCHSPARSWASAVFRHPSVGGEHTYRSFACSKCHPNGYASHYCSCHPGGRPPSD